MSSESNKDVGTNKGASKKRVWSKPALKESPIVDETANPKSNWRFERTFRRFQVGAPTAS